MKYLLTILMLIGVAYGQSTVYLRADTVKVLKQGSNSNFQILNATKDSTNGVLINIGNGVTAFKRIRAINDSQFVVGTDTITIAGATGGGSSDPTAIIKNANYGYYDVLNFHNSVDSVIAKQLIPGTNITFDSTANTITINGSAGTGWLIAGNTLSGDGILGSLSNDDVNIYTNNLKRGEFDNDGVFIWAGGTPVSTYKTAFGDTSHMTALRFGGASRTTGSSGGDAILSIYKATSSSSSIFSIFSDVTGNPVFNVTGNGLVGVPMLFSSWSATGIQYAGSTGSIRATNAGSTTGNLFAISSGTTSAIATTNTNVLGITGNYTSNSASGGTGIFAAIGITTTMNQAAGATNPTAGLRVAVARTSLVDYTSVLLQDSGGIKNDGAIYWMNKKAPATSGNYTVTDPDHFIYLLDLTTPAANRNVVMPTPTYDGRELVVFNTSSDATFKWSFSGTAVVDAAGTTITTLTDQKCYKLRYYYGSWRVISVY